MATCSICANSEMAELVNEMLLEKAGLDLIAEKTGAHRSSVHRHKRKCFPDWRAARLKSRSGKPLDTGRDIVLWPSGEYTWFGETIPASAIRETDAVFIIQYAEPFMEHQHALALREDAERKAKIDGIPVGPA